MEVITQRRFTVGSRIDGEEQDGPLFNALLAIKNPKAAQRFELIIRQGWGLFNAKSCRFSSFKEVFFSLTPYNLKIFNNDSQETLLGLLPFDFFTFRAESSSDSEIKISAFSCKHSVRLKFGQENIKSWLDDLNFQISQSLGAHHKIFRSLNCEKFWKYNRISEKDFLSSADNGDLLLFKSKNTGSRLQRYFTRSKYDHVGLVLRFSNGEVGFIEASRKFGVVFTYWDKYFRQECKNFYSEIVVRKLEVDRSENMISNLQRFVQRAKGKPYSIVKGKSKNKEIEPGLEGNFFCSELVASAYKAMGLLISPKGSFKFMPSDFAESSQLDLMKSNLAGEQKIDLEYLINT